jgi:Alpha-2-macroglobulin family
LSSQPNSRIGLLAFDKSLTFLKTGNDLDKGKIIEEFIKINPRNDTVNVEVPFDGTNYILTIDIDDMDEDDDACTPEQINLKNSIRPDLLGRQDTKLQAYDSKKEYNEIIIDDDGYVQADADVHLRKNFPETWIFQSFDISDTGSVALEYEVPDTITTWLISAFAMNPNSGFALAQSRELVVIQEFFVKTNIPYSVRFGEVLKLDVIAFNMLSNLKGLSAEITLKAKDGDGETQFEFVDLVNPGVNCKMSFLKEDNRKKTVKVKPRSGERAEFYIRPLKTGLVKILVDAASSDGKFKDKIEKVILVENEGIAVPDVKKFIFDYETPSSNTSTFEIDSQGVIDQDITAYSVVTGNLVENVLKYRSDML